MPYNRIVQSVIETPAFIADAKAARVTDHERETIIAEIARNPLAGVEIPGTGGARKIRFAGRGKGKSGGYRVITYYGGADLPVFLLNMFAKSDQIDLSQNDRNELRTILSAVADQYRKGVASNVKGR